MSRKKTVLVNGQEWTKEKVRELLATNEKARIRALMVIYSYQTDHEKSYGCTTEFNGVGFNKLDSEILMSFAKWYEGHNYLSPKQLSILEKRIVKYSNQIFEHMMRNRKEEKVC